MKLFITSFLRIWAIFLLLLAGIIHPDHSTENNTMVGVKFIAWALLSWQIADWIDG